MTEKAQRILNELKKHDRLNRKHWKPYNGPADWNFIVLESPKRQIEERPEVSNG